MSPQDIVRAWKDEAYRLSLSAAQLALVPKHPAGGLLELLDTDLDAARGGLMTIQTCSCTTDLGGCISADCTRWCPV